MASRDPARPNVLFILSDDQGPWAMRCAGTPEIITPHLDAIAASGIRFTDFFCVSPVCSPARASLLTGQVPSAHGVHDWIRAGNMGPQAVDFLAGKTLLTDRVAAAGYRVGLVGKWHLGASDQPRPRYVRWYAHQSGMSPYYDAPMVEETKPVKVEGYLTDDLTDHALHFLHDEAPRAEPFWLSLNYTAPHYPWIDSHPREYLDLYADCDFASCPREAPHPWTAHGNPATDEGFKRPRESLMGYYAATTAMDAGIGRVLAALEAAGLRDSTLVIFMGDNGMNCGHHGIWGKGNGTRPQNMYDSSVKVPCLFAQPGRIAPAVCSELLSAYDVFPTLLDYLGIPDTPGPRRPGTSFCDVLEGDVRDRDRDIVVYDEYGPVRMVRTRQWKYVHRHPDGPHELYDLAGDPGERTNLVGEPTQRDRVRDMRERMQAWFARYADPALDGATRRVTGCGQLGPVPPEGDGREVFPVDPIAALEVPNRTPRTGPS